MKVFHYMLAAGAKVTSRGSLCAFAGVRAISTAPCLHLLLGVLFQILLDWGFLTCTGLQPICVIHVFPTIRNPKPRPVVARPRLQEVSPCSNPDNLRVCPNRHNPDIKSSLGLLLAVALLVLLLEDAIDGIPACLGLWD